MAIATDSSGVTHEDLAEVERRFTEVLEAQSRTTVELLQAQDRHVQALEDQMAVLVLGYADVVVVAEAIVKHLRFDTPEEKAAFDKEMNANRQRMLKVMQDAAATMDGPDKRTADTLSKLVQEQSDPQRQ